MYISDYRHANDRTTNYRPLIVALFSIALSGMRDLFHRTYFTDSRHYTGEVRAGQKIF